MGVSPTALRKEISIKLVDEFLDYAKEKIHEDSDRVSDGAFMIPVLDSEGGEWYAKVTISIPTGERGGDPYDGYAESKNYYHEKAEKDAKKAEAEKKKAVKIAKDKARREAMAKAKAEREAEKSKADA